MQAPGKAPFQAPTQAPKFGHHGMPGYQAWSYQPGYAQPTAGYRAFTYQPTVAGPAAGYRTFSYQPMVGPQRAAGWGQAQTFVGGRPRAYTSAVNKALGNVD